MLALFGWLIFYVFRFVDGPLVIADVGIYGVAAFFVRSKSFLSSV